MKKNKILAEILAEYKDWCTKAKTAEYNAEAQATQAQAKYNEGKYEQAKYEYKAAAAYCGAAVVAYDEATAIAKKYIKIHKGK